MNWYSLGIIHSSFRIRTHFAWYSYSCKILQPYIAARVWMHSDEGFFSIGAYRMEAFLGNWWSSTNNGEFWNMYCLHYAERPQPDNQLSFMLDELVFSRVSSTIRFVSVIIHFVQFKILQPYAACTVQMHSDAVFSSIGASQIETVIKITAYRQIVVLSETTFASDLVAGSISLRKPKVFALQILERYIWRKKVAFENFSTVYMDKRTLRPKIWRARTF